MTRHQRKLRPIFIPICNHGINVRTKLPFAWPHIREHMLKEYNYQCKYCGSQKCLHCHEVWTFDLDKVVQRLVDFEIVCELCHLAIHPGFARFSKQWTKAVKQYCKVNHCSRRTALREFHRYSLEFQMIKRWPFTVDISYVFKKFDFELESPI